MAMAQSQLTPVVVTAARIEQKIDDTFAMVSVLTREDIQAAQAPDLITLLRHQPGVEIAQLGGLGTSTNVFIRGSNSGHTLVLMDGVPLGGLSTGTAPLELIALDSVDRIEIARGNLSSLYGSSALGGVIHIFTHRNRQADEFNAAIKIGSFRTHEEKFDFYKQQDALRWGGSFSSLNAAGFNLTQPHALYGVYNPDLDGVKRQAYSVFAGRKEKDWDLEFRSNRSKVTNGLDVSAVTWTDEGIAQVGSDSLTLQLFQKDWTHQFQWSHMVDQSQTRYNLFGAATTDNFNTRAQRLDWEGQYRWSDQQKLTLGAERKTSQIDSTTLFAQSTRQQSTMRAGLLGEAAQHNWQANARIDDYSDFGKAYTGLLGYGYRFSPAWRMNSTLANGFKAPTFNDLFYPFVDFGGGYTYSGNPLLKPEKSINKEISITHESGAGSWRGTYFVNQYRDLIASNGLSADTYINVGKASITGLELSAQLQKDGWLLSPSVTLQNPKNEVTGKQLERRAQQTWGLGLSKRIHAFGYVLSLKHTGDRYDDAVNTPSKKLSAYTTLDLMVDHQINKDLRIEAKIKNLTNREHEEAYGFGQAGRSFWLGANWKFR